MKELWDSMLRAWIRFFDNRFQIARDEPLDWLRMELQKERNEKNELMHFVLSLNAHSEPEEESYSGDMKPIGRTYTPFSITRARKEKEQSDKAREIRARAANENKSTAQLEKELLGDQHVSW